MPINDERDHPGTVATPFIDLSPKYDPNYVESEDIRRIREKYRPAPRRMRVEDFADDDGCCTVGVWPMREPETPSGWNEYSHISRDDDYGVYVARMVNSHKDLLEFVDMDEWNSYEDWEKQAVVFLFRFLKGIAPMRDYHVDFGTYEYIWLRASLIYSKMLLEKAVGQIPAFDRTYIGHGDWTEQDNPLHVEIEDFILWP